MEKSIQTVKNIVLVHGAFADGSGWKEVYDILKKEGYNVKVVGNSNFGLAEDAATTTQVLDRLDGPAILVGHSYGGAIITRAGNDKRVAGLVYVAAFAPDRGETLAGLAKPYGAMPAFGEIRPIADGYLVLTEKGVTEDFAQDLPAKERLAMVATQGPTQGAILGTTIPSAAWHTKPSWFVIASNDRTISPAQEAATAKR